MPPLHWYNVLILVLVESGLGARHNLFQPSLVQCLNPCFSGKWSWRERSSEPPAPVQSVLILVLVESGLGDILA